LVMIADQISDININLRQCPTRVDHCSTVTSES
jgi:hypothetical protein